MSQLLQLCHLYRHHTMDEIRAEAGLVDVCSPTNFIVVIRRVSIKPRPRCSFFYVFFFSKHNLYRFHLFSPDRSIRFLTVCKCNLALGCYCLYFNNKIKVKIPRKRHNHGAHPSRGTKRRRDEEQIRTTQTSHMKTLLNFKEVLIPTEDVRKVNCVLYLNMSA